MKSTLSLLLIGFTSFAGSLLGEEGFVSLFDGKSLAGWTAARSKGEGDTGAYSVNKEEKAIHCYAGKEAGSKQDTDCLNTEKVFSHFILRLEYKWLENRFQPREDWDRDAGLLFHVHGDLTKVWPLSLEMQIGETPAEVMAGKKDKKRNYHTGDLFVLGKNLEVERPVKDRRYSPEGDWKKGRSLGTLLGKEKPKGEWNEMEIQVHGSEKAIFILNGEQVHEIRNFTQKVDGERVPLSEGRIGLQAEWAEILYRNIRIKELEPEKK